MSLKKRMFRSNMTILCLALFSLLMVVLLVLGLFEDPIERRFLPMEQTKLDDKVYEVVSLLNDAEHQSIKELEVSAGKMGYEIIQVKHGKIQNKISDGTLKEYAKELENQKLDGNTAVFYYRNATVAARYLSQREEYLAAIHLPREPWLETSIQHSFRILMLVLLFICIGAILVLLLLSSFFTKRMNRVVMEPLEKLVKGAERIKDGNLKEPIRYQGEAEFENVCQAFNSMQETILEDQKQRIRNEKARTDMVTGISHDLRTPLTSVQGYIKGVLDGVADTKEKKEQYLRTAYEATNDMNFLLQKLFDFSRLESGQMPFSMVRVDLAEFLNLCIAQKEALISREEVTFSFDSETPFPEILLDVEQFRRVFDNLLENSMKYASVSPVNIGLKVYAEEEKIALVWKDNGPGVPEEKLGKIFERFYRCDEARKKKGSGVGLYVVKSIVERHGGNIRAENAHGLKIILTFPKAGEE